MVEYTDGVVVETIIGYVLKVVMVERAGQSSFVAAQLVMVTSSVA